MVAHVLPSIVLLLTLILWVVVVFAVQRRSEIFDREKIYEPFKRNVPPN